MAAGLPGGAGGSGVVVVGEALVDLVADTAGVGGAGAGGVGAGGRRGGGASGAIGAAGGHGDGGTGGLPVVAHPGGSPANVAVGLARLGVTTGFAGRLAGSGFGPWLRAHLEGNGVDTSASVRAQQRCSLAVVTLDQAGAASYDFYVEGTADWQWRPEELPPPRSLAGAAIHTGSLALALPPGRDVLAAWLAQVREAGQTFVSFDPNVRPTLIDDLPRYRQHVAAVIRSAHLVKVSMEDVALLYPGEDPIEVARSWAAAGPELVVFTEGGDGAGAIRAGGGGGGGTGGGGGGGGGGTGGTGGTGVDGRQAVLRRPAPAVEVVDTVGAGDAFTSGLLARLSSLGALRPGGGAGLDAVAIVECLEFANRVAAITCTRAGANPPALADLEADGLPTPTSRR